MANALLILVIMTKNKEMVRYLDLPLPVHLEKFRGT